MTTNTNDTALIEAMWNEFVKSVEEMPDDGTIEVLDGTGDYFSYAGGKSSAGICQAKVAKRMLSRLREALDAFSFIQQDNHYWGQRPCPTCKKISDVTGKPFGCYEYQRRLKGESNDG